MIISALWAPQIVRFPSLWQYFQAVLAYATPPVVALFLAGMFWPRASSRGAHWAIAVGSGLGLLLFALSITGIWPFQFLNAALVVFVASAAALVLGTLTRKVEPAEVERFQTFTWQNTMRQARETSKSVRGWAVALLLVTAAIVIWFR